MSDDTAEYYAIKEAVNEAFRAFRESRSDRAIETLKAALEPLRERIKRLRMPNQNFFSGYISGHADAEGLTRDAF